MLNVNHVHVNFVYIKRLNITALGFRYTIRPENKIKIYY